MAGGNIDWGSMLALADTWAPILRKLTPGEMKLAMFQKALSMAGVTFDVPNLEKLLGRVKNGEFGAKNMYELLQQPEFRATVTEMISLQGQALSAVERDQKDLVLECPNCKVPFVACEHHEFQSGADSAPALAPGNQVRSSSFRTPW